MSFEDRLKDALSATAVDPGPKQSWDAFLETAHRDRLVHRAVVFGTAALVVVIAVLGSLFAGDVLDRSAPPAQKDKDRNERERRILERDVENVEDRVRRTKELVGKVRIAPGPGNEGSRGGNTAGVLDGGETGDENEAPPEPAVVAAEQSCAGTDASIVGTTGDDEITGTSGVDVIAGLGGDDTIRAGGGDDFICGHAGVDHIYGAAGDDTLLGAEGDDYLDGGEGFDFVLFPTARLDINVNLEHGFIEGDGTDDVLRVEGAEGTPFGDNFVGNHRDNLFIAGDGDDALNGLGGQDTFIPGPGNDGLAGHGGLDTITFGSGGGSGVNVNLARGTATGEGADRLHGVENVNGTAQADTVVGDGRPNAFYGGLGNDTLSGQQGDDVLIGNGGDDTLDGGTGSDSVDGGADSDTCMGAENRRSCERTGPLGAVILLGLTALLLFGRRAKLVVGFAGRRV